MMRSLFSGVSGLRIHQTKMDVIGNNISNVNTVGFKRSTTVFNDVINQTLSGATAANEASGKGGTNAMQIGLGSNVSAVSTVMTTGSTERTDNPNDVMISGDGFFIVSDTTGFYFTRAGAFQVDDLGNLTDSNGMMVNGWSTDQNDEIVKQRVSPLNLYEGTKSYLNPTATDSITFTGNLNPSENPTQLNTMTFYDSLGNSYRIDVTLQYNRTIDENGVATGTPDWTVTFDNKATVNNDSKNIVELNIEPAEFGPIEFNEGGTLLDRDAEQFIHPLTVTWGDNQLFNSTFEPTINVDFHNLTQFKSKADATATTDNGYEAGSLKGYSIGADGIITGSYTNGLTKTLGQIAIADFPNPAGLEKSGNNLYSATTNSGDFDGIGQEIGAGGGKLMGGSLEMSNVDISYEFTQMITTQRGFQANSRIITTSDEMLQELVNLKR